MTPTWTYERSSTALRDLRRLDPREEARRFVAFDTAVKPRLDALVRLGFFVGPAVVADVLARADEAG